MHIHQRNKLRLLIIWALATLAMGMLTGLRLYLRHKAYAAEAAEIACCERAYRNALPIVRQFDDFTYSMKKSDQRWPTVSELEQRFNGGVPFLAFGSEGDFLFVDRVTGARVRIRADEMHLASPLYPPPLPMPPDYQEPVLLGLLWLSRIGCIALAILYFSAWTYRRERNPTNSIALGGGILGIAIIVSYVAWLGSRAFPEFDPMQTDFMGVELLIASPSIFFLLAAYLGDYPLDLLRACKNCGYNLKHNQSGVCPECGTVIASKRLESNL